VGTGGTTMSGLEFGFGFITGMWVQILALYLSEKIIKKFVCLKKDVLV
jgi:hypothetical protein